MSALTRAAETDEQEAVLAKTERWLGECGITPHYGTSVGKSPQSVIADIDHQGGEYRVYVDTDTGEAILSVGGDDITDRHDFLLALQHKGIDITEAHLEAALQNNERVN